MSRSSLRRLAAPLLVLVVLAAPTMALALPVQPGSGSARAWWGQLWEWVATWWEKTEGTDSYGGDDSPPLTAPGSCGLGDCTDAGPDADPHG